ncbi:DcaP family trimeric outer membrane transporter [Namhaeicola litoreus]|uniref:DcaP family trimeric outer membrane transporter n=1 Tax=Namhaeicola litoreus TaxID=1052145 RepID=A0ABW3Y603_9FLAO
MRNILLIAILLFLQNGYTQDRIFTITSKDSLFDQPKYKSSIGANLKLNGYFDVFGGLNDSETFNVGNIVVLGEQDDTSSLNFDLYQSQIKWETVFLTNKGEQIIGVVEGDFWGGNGHFRLRKAYVQSGHWQIGQNWNAFGDEYLWPNIMEWEGPPSGIWLRSPHIKYSNTLRDHRWEYEISFEAPINDYNSFDDLEPQLEEVDQITPDVVIAFKRKMDFGHLRLSGILRNIRYSYEGELDNFFGYGLSFTGIHFIERNNFQFQLVAGKGITAYMTTLGGNGYDGFPNINNELEATPSIGGWGSYEHFITPRLHTNVVFGFTRFFMNEVDRFIFGQSVVSNEELVLNGDYDQLHYYGIFNFMYDVFDKRMTIGLELNYGVKQIKYDGFINQVFYDEQRSRDAMRISFGFMFFF